MEATFPNGQVEFPSLSSGVTLLAVDDRAVGALQSLVLDHLLLGEGTAVWVDARSNAITTMLSRLAPSERVLERISVARGFTPFQHYSIVDDLSTGLPPETELVVVPDVDWLYGEGELQAGEGEQMLDGVLEHLHGIAEPHDIPVLVSRAKQGGLGSLVESRADEILSCELTRFGPRFSGREFETLVFECADGWMQTTLAFWRRLLGTRHSAAFSSRTTEVTSVGSY